MVGNVSGRKNPFSFETFPGSRSALEMEWKDLGEWSGAELKWRGEAGFLDDRCVRLRDVLVTIEHFLVGNQCEYSFRLV